MGLILRYVYGGNKMARKSTPVAVCTKCGEYTCRVESINNRCYKKDGNRRCQGVFGSAIGNRDWDECSVCKGEGVDNNGKCLSCQGYGVVYVRDN